MFGDEPAPPVVHRWMYFWGWREPFTYEGRPAVHLHSGQIEAGSLEEARKAVLAILNMNRKERLCELPEAVTVQKQERT